MCMLISYLARQTLIMMYEITESQYYFLFIYLFIVDVNLPLVPGGYIALKPPFYCTLPGHLKARSLALGAEHAVLLTATGAVYSWGLGRWSHSHICLY